jgi:hypothetical protein
VLLGRLYSSNGQGTRRLAAGCVDRQKETIADSCKSTLAGVTNAIEGLKLVG